MPVEQRLHVVFAGRGDALIVEITDGTERQLMLVDGGPMGRNFSSDSSAQFDVNNGTAPYHKYLMAAMRTIWGVNNTTPIKLAAIINSHPDDDHYGGLVKLLMEHPTNNTIIQYTGDFYTPYMPGVSFSLIRRSIFQVAPNDGWVAQNTALTSLDPLPWLHFHFPAVNQIVKFTRGSTVGLTAGSQLTAFNSTIFASKNDSSILMSTSTAGNPDHTTVFFTGDGSASRIYDALPPPISSKQYPLAVYKIQHHGGWHNQHTNWDYSFDFDLRIYDEFMFFKLLAIALNRPSYLSMDITADAMTAATFLAEFYAEHVRQGQPLGTDRAVDLYNVLYERQGLYRDAALSRAPNQKLPYIDDQGPASQEINLRLQEFVSLVVPQRQGNVRINSKYEDWLIGKNVLQTVVPPFQWTFSNTGEAKRNSWWREFGGKETEVLFGCWNLYGRIMQYYDTFQARAYVASGTEDPHHHPSVPVLMGLALAIKKQDRKATLYLTDPTNIFKEGLEYAATVCRSSVDSLFVGGYLSIRYLATNTFISLNGNTVLPEEVNEYTEPLTDATNKSHTDQLVHLLEQSAKLFLAPSVAPQAEVKRCAIVGSAGSDQYYLGLQLSALTQNVEPVFGKQGRSVYIAESKPRWSNVMSTAAFPIRIGNDATFTQSLDMLLVTLNVNSWPRLWGICNNTGEKTFYLSTMGNLVLKNLNSNLNAIRVSVIEDANHLPLTVHAQLMAVPNNFLAQAQVYHTQNKITPARSLNLVTPHQFASASEVEPQIDSMVSPNMETLQHVEPSFSIASKPETDHASPVLPQDITLREYMNRSGHPIGQLTVQDAIVLMVGRSQNLDAILLVSVYKKLLTAPVDNVQSTVTTEPNSETGHNFSIATLIASQPLNVNFQLGDDNLVITESIVKVTLENLNLCVNLAASSSDGLAIGATKTIEITKRQNSLRDYLIRCGKQEKTFDQVSVASLFAFILQDKQKAASFLSRSLPKPLLQRNTLLLKPDLDLSTASFEDSPIGKPSLQRAHINCILAKGILDDIDISGMQISFSDVAFDYENAIAGDEKITLLTSAKLSLQKGDAVELSLVYVVKVYGTTLNFTAKYLKSITELTKTLPGGFTGIEDTKVPLTKTGTQSTSDPKWSSKGAAALGALKSTQVGFSLREVGKGSAKYLIDNFFVNIDLDDWKEYLPGALKSKVITHPRVRVNILNPTLKTRRAKVEIAFNIVMPKAGSADIANQPIPSEQEVEKLTIKAYFVAEPIGTDADYDFRLFMSSETGLSLADVAALVDPDLTGGLDSSLPLLEGLLTKVKVTKLNLGIDLSSNTVKLAEWSLTIRVSSVDLIPGRFALESLDFTIESIAKGLYQSSGTALFTFVKGGKDCRTSFQLPQKDVPGQFEISAPEGVSLADLFTAANIDLTDIPVVSDVANVKLKSFRISFGYTKSKSGDKSSLGLLRLDVDVGLDAFALGSLKFTDINLEFHWRGPDDIFATGGTMYGWTAEATLPGRTFKARLAYDSSTTQVSIDLKPFTANATLNDLCRGLIPPALMFEALPVIGNLTLNKATCIFNTTDRELDLLDIILDRSASIKLHNTKNSPLAIKSLSVKYTRARQQPKQGSHSNGALPATDKPNPSQALPTTEKSTNGSHFAVDSANHAAMDLNLNKLNEPDDLNASMLLIEGALEINALAARICFTYSSPPSDRTASKGPKTHQNGNVPSQNTASDPKQAPTSSTASFSMESIDKGALSLRNLAELLGLDSVQPDQPDGSPNFLDLQVKYIKGVVSTVEDKEPSKLDSKKKAVAPASEQNHGTTSGSDLLHGEGKSHKDDGPHSSLLPNNGHFALTRFGMVVESPDPFVLLADPSVKLDRLYLQVDYIAQPKSLEVIVLGQMTILKSYVLDLKYWKTKKHGSAFTGTLKSEKNKNDLGLADVLKRLSNDNASINAASGLKLPSSIPLVDISFLFKSGEYLEFSATGSNVWECNFGDVPFRLEELGAYFKIAKAKKKEASVLPDKGTYAYDYDLHLHGNMILNESCQLTATLDLSSQEKQTLLAQVASKSTSRPGNKLDVSSFADKISAGQNSQWSQLIDTSTPVTFHGSLSLYIDFKSAKLVLLGSVDGLGTAAFVARRHDSASKKYDYFFSLLASDIDKLWRDAKDDVSSTFRVKDVTVQVLTYETTTKQLISDLQAGFEETEKSTGEDVVEVKDEKATVTQATPHQPIPAQNGLSTNPENHKLVETNSTLLKDVSETKLLPGGWFFAHFELDARAGSIDSSISSNLAMITSNEEVKNSSSSQADQNKRKTLLIYANLQKAPASTLYKLEMANVELLGGSVALVHGIGQYSPGIKTDPTSCKLDIAIKLSVRGISSSGALDFDSRLIVNSDRTVITAAAAGPAVSTPFQDMFNVKLTNLQFAGTFIAGTASTAKKFYEISGKVALGDSEKEEASLLGSILFDNFKPVGVMLSYTKDSDASITVKDLHSKVLTTKDTTTNSTVSQSATWGDDKPNFRFEAASIYYLSSQTKTMPFQDRTLTSGYRLVADVYLFDKPFGLELNIGASKNSGIEFVAIYKQEINLEVAKLKGFRNDGGNLNAGPSVSVNTKSGAGTSISFKAGVSFFESDPTNVSLSWQPSDRSLQGSLTLPENFPGASKHDVGFTYKNGRFTFSGLKVADEFKDIANLMELLKKGSSAVDKDCGALVDLVFKEVLSGKFRFSLGLPEKPKDSTETSTDGTKEGMLGKHQGLVKDKSGKIALRVKWSYDVLVGEKLGRQTTLFSVNFDDITLYILTNISGKKLLEVIGEHIKENLTSIGEQLVKNPTNLTKIAGLLAAERCVKEVVKSFLCRGATTPELTARGGEHVEQETNKGNDSAKEASKQVEKATDLLKKVGSGGGGGGAAAGAAEIGEALATAAAAIAAGLAILGGVLALKNLVAKNGTKEEKDKVETAYTKAVETNDTAAKAVASAKERLKDAMSVMSGPTLTTIDDTTARVLVDCDWSKAIPPVLSKQNSVTWSLWIGSDAPGDNGTLLSFQDKTSTRHENPLWVYATEFRAKVRPTIVIKGETYQASAEGLLGTLKHIPYLAPPGTVSLAKLGHTLSVGIEPPISSEAVQLKIGATSASGEIDLMDYTEGGLQVSAIAAATLKPIYLTVPPNNRPSFYMPSSLSVSIKAVSKDLTKCRDSVHIRSASPFATLPLLTRDLQALMQQGQVLVSWKENAPSGVKLRSGTVKITIKPTGANTYAALLTLEKPTTTKDGVVQAVFTAPMEIRQGNSVMIWIDNLDQDSLPLFETTTLMVDFLPVYSIEESASYYDFETETLRLQYKSQFDRNASGRTTRVLIKLTRNPGSGNERAEVLVPEISVDSSNTSQGYMLLKNVKDLGTSTKIQIDIRDTATDIVKAGQIWTLNMTSATMPGPVLSTTCAFNPFVLNISWTDAPSAEGITISVNASNGGTNRSSSFTRQQSSRTLSLGEKDLTLISYGTKYKIEANFHSRNNIIRGKKTVTECTVPQPPRKRLSPGEELARDQKLTSTNGRFDLVLQGDGNMVEYDAGQPIWASNSTWPERGQRAIMQPDGNFVLYGEKGRDLLKSNTARSECAGSSLVLQDNGNVTVETDGKVFWSTNSARRTAPKFPSKQRRYLYVNEVMGQGERLTSENQAYYAVLDQSSTFTVARSDGSATLLTVRDGPGNTSETFKLEPSGNLVFLTFTYDLKWASQTSGRGNENSYLCLEDNGDLLLKTDKDVVFWTAPRGTFTSGWNKPGLRPG